MLFLPQREGRAFWTGGLLASLVVALCGCGTSQAHVKRAGAAEAAAERAPTFPYSKLGFGSGTEPTSPTIDPADKDLLQVSDPDDDLAKEELLEIPALAMRESDTGPNAFGGWNPPTDWRPAESLMALRAQLQKLAPERNKSSDGMVGDQVHWKKGEASDHNPWIRDSFGVGVVTAYDVTNSPSTGCDVQKLVNSLVASRDPRIKYVIWNRKIINRDSVGGSAPWQWRPYGGINPHNKHMHLSVLPPGEVYDDTKSWKISVK